LDLTLLVAMSGISIGLTLGVALSIIENQLKLKAAMISSSYGLPVAILSNIRLAEVLSVIFAYLGVLFPATILGFWLGIVIRHRKDFSDYQDA